jgi:hypothetical protein
MCSELRRNICLIEFAFKYNTIINRLNSNAYSFNRYIYSQYYTVVLYAMYISREHV